MSDPYIPAELRRLVMIRGAYICEYCRSQAKYSPDPFTIDHIIAFSLGGPTTEENLACSCFGCNQHKSIRISAFDPITEIEVPLFHPRQHRWDEHFMWNDDFTQMLGLTPIGRATIDALELNRYGLVNWRRAIHAIGEHPPAI